MTVSNLSFGTCTNPMQIAIKHIPTDPSADFHFMKPPTQTLTSVAVHWFAYANPEERG